MQVISHLENIRISPRKMRLVAPLVRGLRVEDALNRLTFTPKNAARPIAQVIKNARADAVANYKLDGDKLKVREVSITEGPTYKRGRPVARGTYHPILKRTSHLKVTLEGEK